jgi:RNA polymerase sigma-70 factor (ECF subfamily)
LNGAGDFDFSASNEELLELCKRQNQEALGVLFRRHERPVYSLLYRMLSNHEDSEEALAEVFVKVWRAAGSFKGDAKFTTWLFRIATNTARDILRSRQARREVYVEDVLAEGTELADTSGSATANPEKHAIDAQEKARIINAMQGLQEEERLLISLYHFQEMDYDQIVQITGIAANNLKVKLFRARRRLKKLCDDEEKEGIRNELRADTAESSGLQQRATEPT